MPIEQPRGRGKNGVGLVTDYVNHKTQ